MARKLANKIAMVTGGSRGIGAAIVTAFAAEGADVIFCHNGDDDDAAAVVAAARANGARVAEMHCDVADAEAVCRFHAEAEHEFGRIDVLVNNAGISGETPFERISMPMFDDMLTINLRALFQFAQLVAPGMRQRGWGRIINIASQPRRH
ncbi:MAG: SDR family NAD(P)-dependent oxidoreductase [Devosia sp.]